MPGCSAGESEVSRGTVAVLEISGGFGIVHNMIRGGTTVPQALKELVKLQKSLE
jgi:hypothetical protein